jgi:spermidine synthase/spermine synthase
VTAQTRLLAQARSPYQTIEIRRHPFYGNQLYIDGDLQISASDRAYNIAMIAPVIAAPQPARRVAILGGGDGGVLHDLLRTAEITHRSLERVTLVDIDPEVIRLARGYLKPLCDDAFDHPRAEVIIGDALAFIAAARHLDAVIYDLTMDPVRAGQTREEFLCEILSSIARALVPGGVLSMQCGGEHDEAMRQTVHAALAREGFTDIVEQRVLVPSYEELWTFLAARRPG